MVLLGPTKRCLKCKEDKPRSQFSKETAHPDGLQRWCKDCARARTAIANKEGKSWRKQLEKKRLESTQRRAAQGLPPYVKPAPKPKEYKRPSSWSVKC